MSVFTPNLNPEMSQQECEETGHTWRTFRGKSTCIYCGKTIHRED